MPHKKIPLIERFVKKVWIDPETGCWIFTGKISKKGYGQIGDENSQIKDAHRVAYRLLVGPIPDGANLDHTCHDPKTCAGGVTCPHRRCVNPTHLKLSSNTENHSRDRACYSSIGTEMMASVNRNKTHCVNGHTFDDKNTYIHQGKRHCKICRKEAQRRAAERELGLR